MFLRFADSGRSSWWMDRVEVAKDATGNSVDLVPTVSVGGGSTCLWPLSSPLVPGVI